MSETDPREHSVRWAAEELHRLAERATPGPWSVGRGENHWGAMVAPRQHPDRPRRRGWEWDAYYGGCLVAESTMPDRDLLIAMRNVTPFLALLLGALADEDPIEAGKHARSLTEALYRTNIVHPEQR